MGRLISLNDALERYKLHPNTIAEWSEIGLIGLHRDEGAASENLYIDEDELIAALKESKMKIPQQEEVSQQEQTSEEAFLAEVARTVGELPAARGVRPLEVITLPSEEEDIEMNEEIP